MWWFWPETENGNSLSGYCCKQKRKPRDDRVICCSSDSVVDWPVEVFYQHDSKGLSSLLAICVEFEVWPRESFDYHAVKIL